MTVTLVRAFSGLVHDDDCPAMRGHEAYKVVAPDIARDEIPAFLAARRLDACGTCLSASKASRNDLDRQTRDAAGRPSR